ncbi:DUF998 domain-containing protein [Ligilactobacillus sp. WILCCON 0076]|uniref:DUF998 domain-containing protein n=1 Tax=Ligilactobacillus ubinensis TaxID=2876789 RepID=A0A9X2JL40_9LACO|nr:DUF998 domain-containing protein [Ligilactobacillus ubinensis]MCP0886662.1 DUF998 domain-containing protein [Ligilactobacillus ubinensis]
MKNKDFQLNIPADISNKLQLENKKTAVLSIRRGELLVQFKDSNSDFLQKKFRLWILLITFLTSLGYYIYCNWEKMYSVKLTGNYSLATSIIIIGGLLGTLFFMFFFILDRNNPHNTFAKNIYWRNFPVIVASFALILILLLSGCMWLLGILFKGATFDCFTASVILFIFCMFVNLSMIYFALIIDVSILSTVFTLVIISGVVISMAVNTNRYWWQHNLSFLGTNKASGGWQFNATLILSALLMLALIDYLFVVLHTVFHHTWRTFILRILLTLVAINLALVGVFPNNASSHMLHDRVAFFLIYFILMLILGIRWLLPNITREFLYLSYGVGLSLVVAEILFRFIGYFSLTAFEIIAFLLAFGWLLALFNQIESLVDTRNETVVSINIRN